jgi:serine/threonine protein phosphatase PrpC
MVAKAGDLSGAAHGLTVTGMPEPEEADVEAKVTIEWPEDLLPEPGTPDGLPVDRLLDELDGLWPELADATGRNGPGCLHALRWYEGWQVASIRPDGAPPGPVPQTPGARERDAWIVASALVSVAAGRAPRDVADATVLLDTHAGTFPHGLDAIVHGMLGGADPASVHAALRPCSHGRVLVRAAAETGVGSRKASGDPAWDNEDAFTTARPPGGGLALALCDGVSGPGDGSGAEASRAAVEALRDCLADDSDVKIAVGVAERAVRRATKGASTLLVTVIHPDGRIDLASLGDSSAWLVRPVGDAHVVARLTPEHTVLAENVIADPGADRHSPPLTRHLGGHADSPYTGSVRTAPGDRIILLSDGAAVSGGGGGWFGTDLAALAGDYLGPASLAAALVARAEQLGGHDNATALIAHISALD